MAEIGRMQCIIKSTLHPFFICKEDEVKWHDKSISILGVNMVISFLKCWEPII